MKTKTNVHIRSEIRIYITYSKDRNFSQELFILTTVVSTAAY